MQGQLNVARDTLGLTRRQPLENAPPLLAFTTMALDGNRVLEKMDYMWVVLWLPVSLAISERSARNVLSAVRSQE